MLMCQMMILLATRKQDYGLELVLRKVHNTHLFLSTATFQQGCRKAGAREHSSCAVIWVATQVLDQFVDGRLVLFIVVFASNVRQNFRENVAGHIGDSLHE